MNYFKIMRDFWDFCFSNPDKVKPLHIAIFCFAVEHNNRLGWRDKFGFPTMMVCDAIGVKSVNTFTPALNDLCEWGLIKMVEKSKNQYSSNIIALSSADPKSDKALDKALAKHTDRHMQSTPTGTCTIIRPNTIDWRLETREERAYPKFDKADFPTIEQCKDIAEISGHDPSYGEAYFYMRDADGWCKPRGKGEHMQMVPIANWRSDYANAYNNGYLKPVNSDGLNF